MLTGENVIWMNGAFVPANEATVPFLNNTLHYGIGFFEGIRSYQTHRGAAVFRLRDHTRRLFESIKIGGTVGLKYSEEEIIAATKETVRRNGLGDAYIRPLAYFQGRNLGMSITDGELLIGIAAWHWPSLYTEEAIRRGLSVCVSSFTRMSQNAFLLKAKACGNYVNSLYAHHEAIQNGYDETVLLDAAGNVAECSGENIFMVKRGKLYTPPLATVLDGITRDSLIAIARDRGYDVIEAPIARDMLYTADEVFLTGSAAEVNAIASLDRRPIGCGEMGPITAELRDEFLKTVRGIGKRSSEWCDYVEE